MKIIIDAPDGDHDTLLVGLAISRRLVEERWYEAGVRSKPRHDTLSGQPFRTTANMSNAGIVVVVERTG